jgi:outer membrane lipoprotein LolB
VSALGCGGFAAALLLVLAAGCATPPPVSGELPLAAAGRMALRVEAHGGRPAQSQSAAFEWRGAGERGALNVLSPLGTQVAQARWAPGEVWLVTPEGTWRFDTLEELAEQAFGERLPLQAWGHWLAGRPWPGAAAAPLEQPEGPAGFEQLGWRVDLSRHAEGRIEARREAPPAVFVRIVLDKDAGGRP